MTSLKKGILFLNFAYYVYQESQQKQDLDMTVTQVMSSLLQNLGLS